MLETAESTTFTGFPFDDVEIDAAIEKHDIATQDHAQCGRVALNGFDIMFCFGGFCGRHLFSLFEFNGRALIF